ncbi:MAG: class I SAM-dependent methyltransferase [Rhodospirillaceae bacterium]
MNNRLDTRIAHLADQFATISGWCPMETFWIWATLLRTQIDFKVPGHLMEIGVFRGKSAAILAAFLTPDAGEKLALIDIKLQTDHILESLDKAGLDTKNAANLAVNLIEARSSLLALSDIDLDRGSARWIHIDGEHTGPAVEADLELSHLALSDDGIVVLDDFFAPEYPQVTWSALRYLERYKERFTPVLVGYRKLYLCRPKSARWYKQAIVARLVPTLENGGFLTTLCKTTTAEDLDCFGIAPRYLDEVFRGTEDDYNRLWLSKGYSPEDIEKQRTPDQ